MRLAGASLLAGAGLLFGLRTVWLMGSRLDRCGELCRMLALMSFELERFRTPLPQLLEDLSGRLRGKAAEICALAGAELETGAAFAVCWRYACGSLPAEEREILLPLGAVLGRYGGEEQQAALVRASAQMEALREELHAGLRDRRGVIVGASAAGAALLAVLLL